MMATMALVLPTFWGRRSYLYPDGPLGGQLCVSTGWHVGAGRCWARMGGAWEVLLQRDAGRPAALLCGGGRPCRGHTVAPVALRWRCARPEAADMCDRGRTAWRLRSLSPRKQHWRLVALATPLIIVTDACPADTFWLSCCCCCLPLRLGSTMYAQTTSRRPVESFQTSSTDQERRSYVALAALLDRLL